MDDTARLVATILLAAFVIERAGAAFAFFADKKLPEWNLKIARFTIAGILGAIAVWFAHIRVLAQLHNNVSPWIDYPLSWLIVVAGADRIRDFLGGGEGAGADGGGGAAAKSEVPPIQISITDKDGRTKLYELKAD